MLLFPSLFYIDITSCNLIFSSYYFSLRFISYFLLIFSPYFLFTFFCYIFHIGFATTSLPYSGGRGFWFNRISPSNHRCIYGNATNLNITHGELLFNPLNPAIGNYNPSNLLNLTNGINLQYSWTISKNYTNFTTLYNQVYAEYNIEHTSIQNKLRASFDPYIYDLYYAIKLIEEHGEDLEGLIWLENGFDYNNVYQQNIQPGRSDMCMCERATLCPNGTTSVAGSSAWSDCTPLQNEILRRGMVVYRCMSVMLVDNGCFFVGFCFYLIVCFSFLYFYFLYFFFLYFLFLYFTFLFICSFFSSLVMFFIFSECHSFLV